MPPPRPRRRLRRRQRHRRRQRTSRWRGSTARALINQGSDQHRGPTRGERSAAASTTFAHRTSRAVAGTSRWRRQWRNSRRAATGAPRPGPSSAHAAPTTCDAQPYPAPNMASRHAHERELQAARSAPLFRALHHRHASERRAAIEGGRDDRARPGWPLRHGGAARPSLPHSRGAWSPAASRPASAASRRAPPRRPSSAPPSNSRSLPPPLRTSPQTVIPSPGGSRAASPVGSDRPPPRHRSLPRHHLPLLSLSPSTARAFHDD